MDVPTLGVGLVGVDNDQQEIRLTRGRYNQYLSGLHGVYPSIDDLSGMILPADPEQDVSANNPPKYIVNRDKYALYKNPKERGLLNVSLISDQQQYAIIINPQSDASGEVVVSVDGIVGGSGGAENKRVASVTAGLIDRVAVVDGQQQDRVVASDVGGGGAAGYTTNFAFLSFADGAVAKVDGYGRKVAMIG